MTTRPIVDMDLETYPDFFLAKFRYPDGTYKSFSMWPENPAFDIAGVMEVLASVTVITFNGNKYDIPMLTLALYGATNAQLKEANDDIIVRGMGNTPWTFYEKWGIQPLEGVIDSIDVMEVAPGVRISLKMLMGRMHAPKLQDLPYDPDTALDGPGRFVIADYCGNDLVGTALLRETVWERVKLRMAIGERYKIDVRSKSDAQIAEAVVKAQLDFKPQIRYIKDGYTFGYTPPPYVQFATPHMRELLEVVKRAQFVVRDKEEAIAMGYYDPEDEDAPKIRTGVRIPEELAGRDIRIGLGLYRMGIGGLHSQEKCTYHHTDDNCTLRDVDVKSYYPSMILAMNMVPEQLGPAFSIIYRSVYERRLKAKSEADRIAKLYKYMGAQELKDESDAYKIESDGLKIVLNGTFGKLFSKWSIFFAPELGIATTITGQLLLLMLIEMMELSGIQVVSANTDGIILKIPRGLETTADSVVAWWEQRTKLEMEATLYRSVYQRDVNNYIAIGMDGKVKRKGAFNQGGVLSGPQGKGPNMDIAADAVVAYLKDGTPIIDTIMACADIRKFIVLRGVGGQGGPGYFDANDGSPLVYLGKAVRWYYSTRRGSARIINRSGNKVATSDGAQPCMELPAQLPDDIDYFKYERAAMEMLASVGGGVRYWWYDESGCAFITHDYEPAGDECEEITKTQYKKRK